jgi:hypothetical protein
MNNGRTDTRPYEADEPNSMVIRARHVPHIHFSRGPIPPIRSLGKEIKLLRVSRSIDHRIRAEVLARHPDGVLALAHREHDTTGGQDLRGEGCELDGKVCVRRHVLDRVDVGGKEVHPFGPISVGPVDVGHGFMRLDLV